MAQEKSKNRLSNPNPGARLAFASWCGSPIPPVVAVT